MSEEIRKDIRCFCGGELVKGRTVAWDCGSCGEQWWPHLWDKLQKANSKIKKLEEEVELLNYVDKKIKFGI
jgi:hypothetical protein